MNKHLLKALRALAHPALIQTAALADDSYDAHMALDIRLMDRDREGNRTSVCETRYVRISDSSGNREIVPLCLDNGEAYLRLEDIKPCEYAIVQCDESGHALTGGDVWTITYTLNGKTYCDDGIVIPANIHNQCIEIANMPNDPITLHISKSVVNEFGEPLDFCHDMEFCLSLEGCGFRETIILNMENQFHTVLEGLRPGTIRVKEEEQPCYRSSYLLDGCEWDGDKEMMLTCGDHTLEVINQKHTANVLLLDQFIRRDDGELVKPGQEERFIVWVGTKETSKQFVLDEENNFSLRLYDLPGGTYQVRVNDQRGRSLRYIVNAGCESNEAMITLNECEEGSVLIIAGTPLPLQNSPLRICKYIRSCEGEWRKPDAHEHFKVMLSGCGSCEIFNLNAHNNFCVDIGHLCCGEYEIKELDHSGYVPAYIVNDGGESTSAKLWIHENSCNCVTILNEEKNKGALTISKMIRESDGTLVKPEKSARFLITLRSYFTRETYVLDANNDFCVHIHHLKEGSYEIKEQKVNGFDTTYIVNGGKEESKARLVVMNDTCGDVKIINSVRREISGDLRITKYIANAYGDYTKPNADEEFVIHVEGPCLDACYTLRYANSWCITLEGLKKGVYRISESTQGIYDTQYFVNGCEMNEAALVCMEHQNQEVMIVNTKKSYGNLKLNIMVQECDSHLRKPNQTEFFDVIVETGEGSRELRFDQRNNFGMLLEDLPCGKVRITQKDNYGYRVIYEVNGNRQNHADVVMDGANEEVTIINQMMGCSGVVTVRKLVKTLHGRIVPPCAQDVYSFTLDSRCIHECYTLSEKNNFCVLFDDLEEGEYEIKEAPTAGMTTRYRINGKECDSGQFTLRREDIEIEIINTVLPLPKLSVHKRIRNHGKLEKPQCGEVFHFQLIGRDVHETYCLNQENDWCVTLEDLRPRHYEIRELHQDGNVLYQINDCLYEQGTFLFDHEDMEITMINDAGSDALVHITKMMRDECGNLGKPCRGERFDIVLESDCFKQCFTLDERNDWCVELEGLSQGTYTVKEVGCDYAELFINGIPNCQGEFELEDEDIKITMINTMGCENSLTICANVLDGETIRDPQSDAQYHIFIEHEGVCDALTLDCDNDWCIELANIETGRYVISAAEPLLYEQNGEWFEQGIEVKMGCDHEVVNLYAETDSKPSMEITLSIQDENGNEHAPLPDACYSILVCGQEEECFQLNAANDWGVRLCDYPRGEYEIIAMDVDAVHYQIDDLPPTKRGIVYLRDRSVAVHIIIGSKKCDTDKEEKPGAILRLHAMVQNCAGELESAPANARFEVMLDGDQIQEDMILTHRNGFQREFSALPQGAYTIKQHPNEAYGNIMYRINGTLSPQANITLAQDEIQVDIINYQNCETGSIYVMKYLSDASCNCLKRPCMDESYTITLCGEQGKQSVVLNASNHWSYRFSDLPLGRYTIEEENGHHVTYIVNGGKELPNAEVNLKEGAANVKIINPLTPPSASFGSIELCKYVKDENGKEQEPDPNDSFWVTLKGEDDTQRILLHAANHFYARIPHLKNGAYEIVEESSSQVSYRVDGGEESRRAIVSVSGGEHRVDILNPLMRYGNITLTKFIRQSDDTLKVADSGSWRVHISAPDYDKAVTLDASNRFSVVLANLKKGTYVIEELDHENVSYRIDGGQEMDHAVVSVCASHDVAIINTGDIQPQGEIRMTKYLRNATGQLIRPSGTASYSFHISKPGYEQSVTLNQGNQWTATLSDLASGNYVIRELGDQPVSYIINDQSECDFGIVAVAGDVNTVSIINHENHPQGSIIITKYVRNDAGQLVRPMQTERFQVHVSRPGYNEIFDLTAENHWTVTCRDLADGDYVLDEIGSDNDEVTWRINGGYEVSYALVSVARNENRVDMINHQSKGYHNHLYVEKWLRNNSGQLVKPGGSECFQFQLSGAHQEQIVLDRDNQWRVQLDNLPDGNYELKEQNHAGAVRYSIDGGEEQDTASFTMHSQDVHIHAINQNQNGHNILDLMKYIRDENGELHPAEGNAAYEIEIRNSDFRETYTLNAGNHFHERVYDLPNGTYQIEELGNGSVTYRINGGAIKNDARVTIADGRYHAVEIINNHSQSINALHLYQFVSDASNKLHKPAADQVFRALLTGTNTHQFYTLSRDNDWHVEIDNLRSGDYEVIAQGNDGMVKYMVNGADFSNIAEITAAPGRENTVEIVSFASVTAEGTLVLEKRIRNGNGELSVPSNGEGFTIRVYQENGSYDETFTLDSFNDYTLSVSSLPYGTYQLEEIDNNDYDVSFIVDNDKESQAGVVTVSDAAPHHVIVVNTETSMFFHISESEDLHVVIE